MKRFLCLLCIFALIVPVSAADLNIPAKSAVLMDVATGQLLYEQDSHTPLAPASVTKVMTMLLIMEAIDSGRIGWDDTVTTSEAAAAKGGSQVYLKVGETMSVSDMVKSIAVSSANDCACAMAEHIAGSEAAFVELMNKRAKELGMYDTTFVNCTGLDDSEDAKNHKTSAYDIALMSRELLKNHPDIKKFTTIWMDTVRDGAFGLSNTNKLVRFYPGATGLKTGFTSQAGYCLSASALREEMELVAVVMGCETSKDRFAACKSLLDHGFAGYALITPQQDKAEIPVKLGTADFVSAIPSGLDSVLIDKGQKAMVTQETELLENVEAPVSQGQRLGTLYIKAGEQVLKEIPLVAETAVPKLTFWQMFSRLLQVLTMSAKSLPLGEGGRAKRGRMRAFLRSVLWVLSCRNKDVPSTASIQGKILFPSSAPLGGTFSQEKAKKPGSALHFRGNVLEYQLLVGAGDLCGNLISEVLFLLLDALTLDVVNGVHEGDLAAQLLGSVSNVASHIALKQVGADKLLLQQADLLVEGVHLTGSDLLLDLGRLVSHLGIVVHQSNLNGQLLVDLSLGHLGLIPVLSAHSSDLHSNVLTDLGSVAAFHSQVHQNAVGAACVNIGNRGVLSETGEAADLHILADGHNLLLHNLGNGQVGIGVLGSLQSLHISGVSGSNHLGQVLNQVQESVGLGSEVGLGVHLDHNAHAVHDSSVSNAFSSDAVSLLCSLSQALLTEPVNSLVHITVGSGQSSLAVHHADVGHFTELLNIQCSKCHFIFPPIITASFR